MITKSTFNCFHCGECCKPIVVLNQEDIDKISNAGFDKQFFLDQHPYIKNAMALKRNSDGCVFLKFNPKGESFCSIYEHRPEICKKYPFFDNKPLVDCLPKKGRHHQALIEAKDIIDRRGFL